MFVIIYHGKFEDSISLGFSAMVNSSKPIGGRFPPLWKGSFSLGWSFLPLLTV